MKPIKVFLDSDVVISALLSSTGAAFLLINHSLPVKFISNFSKQEIIAVANRLKISPAKTKRVLQNLSLINLKQSLAQIKKTYKIYVKDVDDSHIIAGAVAAKTRFLLSYNLKHYHTHLIKKDFDLIIYTPAQFLQYTRSL
jgi:predicted nucleic acid-binding protein